MPVPGNIDNNKKVRLTLLDNVNVCLESFGDHVMHLVFGAEVPLDVQRFSHAIRLSLDVEPILGCRLVDKGWKPYWTRWSAEMLDGFQYCELVSALDVDQQIQASLLRTMDCRTEPMVQARIIRGASDVVVLNVNCVPIDGRGLLIYLERLLDIYNNLGRDPAFTPVSGTYRQRSTDALVKYFRWPDAFKLVFYGLLNQWVDRSTAANWTFPARQSASLDKAFHYHQFDPRTLALIHEYRKRAGFTFNDILLAAFYHALQQIVKPASGTTCCVLNTYDLRRYETDGSVDRVANYSSFINSNVTLEADLPFVELIARVRDAMAARKQHYPGITEGPFVWPVFKLLPFPWARALLSALLRHRGEHIPVLTNVGVIDIEKLRLDGHRVQWVLPFAPLEYPPKLTVTLATVGDVITLSLGYSRNHFDSEQIAYLFREMEAVIVRHCSGEPSAPIDAAPDLAAV